MSLLGPKPLLCEGDPSSRTLEILAVPAQKLAEARPGHPGRAVPDSYFVPQRSK